MFSPHHPQACSVPSHMLGAEDTGASDSSGVVKAVASGAHMGLEGLQVPSEKESGESLLEVSLELTKLSGMSKSVSAGGNDHPPSTPSHQGPVVPIAPWAYP